MLLAKDSSTKLIFLSAVTVLSSIWIISQLQQRRKQKKESLLISSKPITIEMSETDKEYTLEELQQYDGRDPSLPILIAIDGVVYNVSYHASGIQFYGLQGSYNMFAGHDATRCFACMSFDLEDLDRKDWGLNLDIFQRVAVEEWRQKFNDKYQKVGHLKW